MSMSAKNITKFRAASQRIMNHSMPVSLICAHCCTGRTHQRSGKLRCGSRTNTTMAYNRPQARGNNSHTSKYQGERKRSATPQVTMANGRSVNRNEPASMVFGRRNTPANVRLPIALSAS